jgi:GMP synthase (glutamine-hydrolysing)
MKRAAALRHVAFEDLDGFEAVLARRGFAISYCDVPTDDLAAEALRSADLVVVLGGPIGAYEERDYPFLAAEIALIERRLRHGQPVLGLCLGAQLMARALGTRVSSAGVKELGWAPLTLTPDGRRSSLAALEGRSVLHWHGDTFDLPTGAACLASTARTPNQAFAWERHALALQFHVETTARGLERWYVGHTLEIATTADVSVAALRADAARHAAALVDAGGRMLEAWLTALGL